MSGQRVELRHFGSFALKIRKARAARNPRTGDKIFIKEKKVPVFKNGNIAIKFDNYKCVDINNPEDWELAEIIYKNL